MGTGGDNVQQITYNTDWAEHIKTFRYESDEKDAEGKPKKPYEGGEAILANMRDMNKFSWVNQLLVPGLQAGAQLLIAKKQKEDYDDIYDSQKNAVTAAVDNYTGCINALLPQFAAAYPDVPACAEYVPVDICDTQLQTILCNLKNAGATDEYVKEMNRQHHQNSLIRANYVVPLYTSNANFQAIQIQDLLNGKLPVDEVIEVLTDNAERACLQGRIGNSCRQTFRDLGVSRLRAQAQGRAEFREQLASTNRDVAPVSQQIDVQSMMFTPQQRLAFALQQTLYIQSSLQNCYNRDAQKPPHLFAELQAKLQHCVAKLTFEASKANMINTFVPNYQAILNPLVSGLASGAGSLFQGGYNTQQGAVQAGWQNMNFGMDGLSSHMMGGSYGAHSGGGSRAS